LDIYWNILTMHVPINVKSPNNINEWQMGFNSAFKGLMRPAGTDISCRGLYSWRVRKMQCCHLHHHPLSFSLQYVLMII